ncbi:hypothetical protein ABFX02_02G126100 [Erythranthe guttata]
MVDVNLMDSNFSDLDLNQEPADPVAGSFLNGLATARGTIEERIRQLEAVTARQRHRQRQRSLHHRNPNPMEIVDGINNMGIAEDISHKGKGFKRDRSHLVATALESNSAIKRDDPAKTGSFYDCNICLDMAKDPVLTCCGHLFCWACFYQVSNIDSTTKECPVCKGEVSNSTTVPIYGNGGGHERVSMTESGLMIPPRLKAPRIESVRQQQRANNNGGAVSPPNIPVLEALRRLRSSGGAVSHQTREREAASLSSLSSALSNTERLVEDLQTVINNQFSINDAHAQASSSSSSVNAESHVPPYFLRSRSMVARTSDANNQDTRETRRRRLN